MPLTVQEYEKIFIEFGFENTDSDMEIINKILTENPTEDAINDLYDVVISHKTMLRIVLTAMISGVKYENIIMRLEQWSSMEGWSDLANREYAWPTYILFPELVSWEKVFTPVRSRVYYEMAQALAIPGIANNIERKVAVLKFYSEFDYGSCFNGMNIDVKNRMSSLMSQKSGVFGYCLLNVFEQGTDEYFVARAAEFSDPDAAGAAFWDSNIISSQRKNFTRPKIGEPVFTNKAEFSDRFFNNICKGLLTKSPNPELNALNEKFPFAGVIISGGSVVNALKYTYNPQGSSDVDIFIVGATSDDRISTFKKIIEWFTCPGKVFFAIKGGVVCIYVKDIDRQFQIINTNMINGFAVIDRFDLSHLQFLVKITEPSDSSNLITAANVVGYEAGYFANSGLQVYGTYKSFNDQRMNMTRICNTNKLSVIRLLKALYNGYDIEYNEKIRLNDIDISRILARPRDPDVQGYIRKFSGAYYPSSADFARYDNEDDAINYALRMIELEHPGSIISTDSAFVIENTQFNINFDIEYDSLSYTRFNIINVIDNGRNRDKGKFNITNRNGVIYIIGGLSKVIDVSNEDGNVNMRLQLVDLDFKKFIKTTLETDLMRRFTQKPVTKHILEGPNEDLLSIQFEKQHLAFRADRGDTCARMRNGKPISLDEDVIPGDLILPMYQIRYNINDQAAEGPIECNLAGVKIVKQNGDDDEDTEASQSNIEEISKVDKTTTIENTTAEYETLSFE